MKKMLHYRVKYTDNKIFFSFFLCSRKLKIYMRPTKVNCFFILRLKIDFLEEEKIEIKIYNRNLKIYLKKRWFFLFFYLWKNKKTINFWPWNKKKKILSFIISDRTPCVTYRVTNWKNTIRSRYNAPYGIWPSE